MVKILLQPWSGGTSGKNVALRILAFAWPFVVWIVKGGRDDNERYESLPLGTGEVEELDGVVAEEDVELIALGSGEADALDEVLVGGIDGN